MSFVNINAENALLVIPLIIILNSADRIIGQFLLQRKNKDDRGLLSTSIQLLGSAANIIPERIMSKLEEFTNKNNPVKTIPRVNLHAPIDELREDMAGFMDEMLLFKEEMDEVKNKLLNNEKLSET